MSAIIDAHLWELLTPELCGQIVTDWMNQRYPARVVVAITVAFTQDGIDPVELFRWDGVVRALPYINNTSLLAMHLQPRSGVYWPRTERFTSQ